MKTPPKEVDSPQDGIHKNLNRIVNKHINHKFRQPIREHNLHAFNTLKEKTLHLPESRRILDSCCGTGMSSHRLANLYPQSAIIGIDQSEVRLEKQHNHAEDQKLTNLHFIRSNCEDIWRLCVENDIRFDLHTIFYPNPYPKSTQVKRRWHGHAVFPYLPKLANKTVLRSNWSLYLEEFAFAWEAVTGKQSDIKQISAEFPMTLFEKKYAESGQAVYELELFTR